MYNRVCYLLCDIRRISQPVCVRYVLCQGTHCHQCIVMIRQRGYKQRFLKLFPQLSGLLTLASEKCLFLLLAFNTSLILRKQLLKNQLHLVYSCKENPQGIRYCERILKIERNETTAIYKILGYCGFLWFFFKKMSKTVTLVTISSQFQKIDRQCIYFPLE